MAANGDLVTFGRRFAPDDRDQKHLIPRKAVETLPVRKSWTVGQILDQGQTPQCVGYAGFGYLIGGPVLNKPKFTATDLYHEAQKRDEWKNQPHDGSSTRGLFKALTDLGYVTGYQWAFDVQPIIGHVLTVGPVCVGTDWFSGMSYVDKRFFLSPSGQNQGGHEWRLVGADREKKCPDGTVGAFRMANSWSRSYADKGLGWISFAHMDYLIKKQGEACTAKEVLKA